MKPGVKIMLLMPADEVGGKVMLVTHSGRPTVDGKIILLVSEGKIGDTAKSGGKIVLVIYGR